MADPRVHLSITTLTDIYCIFSVMHNHIISVNASQNILSDIIDGFLKIFRLERIDVRDHSHSTPILYVYTNRSLTVLSALRSPWFCCLAVEVMLLL